MNSSRDPNIMQSSGYCITCKGTHRLDGAKAVSHCEELMTILDKNRRIDLENSKEDADPALSTDYLFGPARGQMFAVMVYRDKQGRQQTARAFSGQYNGRWEVAGWVSPIINSREFYALTENTECEIKNIGKKMESFSKGSPTHRDLARRRKELSQNLMRQIHAIYRVHNFQGEKQPMPKIVNTSKGIPTGTGDCCAPKLLNFAAKNGFTPIAIAEFYYGLENRSGSKKHKYFYSSCTEKCGLILGYMLCGLD